MTDKIRYRVPPMAEIEAVSWNGCNVVSTFSGIGGSCLGYRMAGYRVLWANEFNPHFQSTYRRNHPNSFLDIRDIRDIQPSEILDTIQLRAGELDLLDGSPPCDNFSIANTKPKIGQIKKYAHTSQRTDDLFLEYTRLLDELQPKVFVAENVAGLLFRKHKTHLDVFLSQMKSCGYRVEVFLLNAADFGVPQRRRRAIFVGVRSDLAKDPVAPAPYPHQYTVEDAIPWVHDDTQNPFAVETKTSLATERVRRIWQETEPGDNHSKAFYFTKLSPCSVSYTVHTYRNTYLHPFIPRTLSTAELKRIQSFPDDFILEGSYSQEGKMLGLAVPPFFMKAIAQTIYDEILSKCISLR